MLTLFLYLIIFLYGVVIGSFLNVCILRIPKGESLVSERSHCMSCGHRLAWYDLFPLFSYLFLRGKCRYCGAKISAQYPIIEAANALTWCLCFWINGFNEANGYSGFVISLLEAVVCSCLLTLSVIDARTQEIPFSVNLVIACMGVVRMLTDLQNWSTYVIGFAATLIFFLLIVLITKGKGMGGGDVKLMAAAGLFLGWKLIPIALIFGCLFGSVIHITLMKVKGAGRVLAMGPYFSAGIVIAMWWGEALFNWYTSLF